MVKAKQNEIIYMNPVDLVPYHNNPRKNKEAVDVVASSIREYGFKQPIVVDKDNIIIVGHTRYYASLKLKLDSVPVIVASDLTPEQAKAYRLVDNRTGEYAEWDMEALESELKQLEELGINLDDYDFQLENKIEPEYENEDPEIKFATELDEESNYVVLKFDRDIDFFAIEQILGLESVYSKRTNGKPWTRGVGRVVDGVEAMRLIKDNYHE